MYFVFLHDIVLIKIHFEKLVFQKWELYVN